MKKNVFIGRSLRARINAGTLNAADYFVLALSDRLAGLLPAATVYTDPRRQGTKLPAVFVAAYQSTAQRALGGVLAIEFQAEVSYLAAEKFDAGELSGVLTATMEMPRELPTEIGIFELKGRSAAADAVEGRAQMLCRAEARLIAPDDSELMQKLIEGADLNNG